MGITNLRGRGRYMRTAGKAFTAGLFGTIGVGAAIIGVSIIGGYVADRKVKRMLREWAERMRLQTEAMRAAYESEES